MVTALFDTGILIDYLLGDKRAGAVFKEFDHRALSVITWMEVMVVAPEDKQETTRAFLRSFERLSISESIADEALRLIQERPGLPFHRALTWGTAVVNQIPFVTADGSFMAKGEKGVLIPYSRSKKGNASRRPKGR